jgi:HK97 family phage major capsid protein
MTTADTVADLIKNIQAEVKKTAEAQATIDAARLATFEELKKDVLSGAATITDTQAKLDRISKDMADAATKMQSLQETINTLAKKVNRPGAGADDIDTKASAVGLLEAKHFARVTKRSGDHPFTYTADQLTEAEVAVKAIRSLMHCTNVSELPDDYRKALSSFNLGSTGFFLAPEMSSTILSCLEDVTDITGLMTNLTISGPSIKFLVDNELWDVAAWACESQCFANNPTQQIGQGLGEVEVKPESLRYIVCTTRELLEDSSANLESWMLQKVNRAYRTQISNAIITGDGIGKPLGILRAGIPIVDTNTPPTPVGQFTWQDLVLLKYMVPSVFQGAGGAYLMNQTTFGLSLTMSDAMGRPIMMASPLNAAQYIIAGSPVVIANQMPDVVVGSTPVAFGNWKQAYMMVNRKAVTMQQDPYSAGFCVLFKFEARIGGAPICPNAARLLRIT